MASLGLQASAAAGFKIGLFFPGAAGVFAATVAGFALDYKFIFPALFKQRPPEGPRLNDLGLSQTQVGAPAVRAYGEMVRTAGWTIWQTRTREVKDPNANGKGGTGGSYIVYKYYKHAAIEIGRIERNEPIGDVVEILADGKSFFSSTPNIDYSTNDIRAEVHHEIRGSIFSSFSVTSLKLISNHATGGPDLSRLKSGRNVTIGGFTGGGHSLQGHMRVATTQLDGGSRSSGSTKITLEADFDANLYAGDTFTITGVSGTYTVITPVKTDYNGVAATTWDPKTITFTPALAATAPANNAVIPTKEADNNNISAYCFSSGYDEVANESYAWFRERAPWTQFMFGGCDAGDTVTIKQTQPQFSPTQVESISIYKGGLSQIPDPTIVSIEQTNVGGAANVPAFTKRAFFVAKSVELTDFGNRLPNFEIIWRPNWDATLATALRTMFLDAKRPEGSFDLSAIDPTKKLGGLVVRGPTPLKTVLQPLIIAYDLLHQETTDGILRIFPRTAATVHVVTTADLGAHPFGEEVPYPIEFEEAGDIIAAQTVVVKYYDPELNYQVNSVFSGGTEEISGETTEVDTQLVLDKNTAQQLADKLYAQSQLGRIAARWTMMPSWFGKVHENDVIAVTANSRPWTILVTRVDVRTDYILECEGVEEDLEILNQTATSEATLGLVASGTFGPNARTERVAPPLDAVLLDIPAPTDEYVDRSGFWIGASLRDRHLPWRHYDWFESYEIDSAYRRRAGPFNDEAVIGRVNTEVVERSRHVIDYESAIEVTVYNGNTTIESVTTGEMLLGRNRFLIGDCIIGAADVELIAVDEVTQWYTYRLTKILWGIADTFESIHYIGERFVWLDGPGLYFVPISATRLKEAIYGKLVYAGGLVDDAPSELFTPTGRNMQPPRVVQVKTVRNGSNDNTITWERQLKRVLKHLEDATPLDEEVESYILRFCNSTFTTVHRQVVVTSARTYTYTNANHTTDYGNSGANPFYLQIVPVSKFFHEGRSTEVTL